MGAVLEEEERRLIAALAASEREEAELQKGLEKQRLQEEQLCREEECFWLTVAEYQLDFDASEDESALTASAIQYAAAELNRLKRTNILNDTFHIQCFVQDGSVGT